MSGRAVHTRRAYSVASYEAAGGTSPARLSRPRKLMARYGIVDLTKDNKTVRPVVKATEFQVEFGLNRHFPRIAA